MEEKEKEVILSSGVGVGTSLRMHKVEGVPKRKLTIREMVYWALPHRNLSRGVLKWRVANTKMMTKELWKLWVMLRAAGYTGYPFFYGDCWLRHIDGRSGEDTLLGLASVRLFTSAGRDEVIDEFDAATAAGFDLTTFNYHGLGTGTTAANAADTALQTELTTEYTGNVRATGVQSQPTSDVYRSVATNTLDSGTPAVTEAGLLSQAATGGGVLVERYVFAAVNLVGANGDGLQTTMNLTMTSGS